MSLPSVSIILPVRNEEKFIQHSLESILNQDYPQDRLEVVVADGRSTDRTRDLVKEAAERNGIPIRLVDNPGLNQPAGVNAGVREAKGDLIVRMDAHAVYAPDYVSQCVEVMQTTGAGNVGGVALPVPVNGSVMARAIVLAHQSRFGLGGARFRIGKGYEGPVDTFWLGCWRKETFLKLGGFDERYPRTEDIVFNQRLREAGHKVWLSPRIRAWYFCRGTLRELWKQNWANGKGVIDTLPMNRRAIGLRHLVPLLFLLSLLGLGILSVVPIFITSQLPNFAVHSVRLLLAAEMVLYLVLSLIFSLLAVLSKSLNPNFLTSQLPNLAVQDSVGSCAPQHPGGGSGVAGDHFAFCTLHFSFFNTFKLFLSLPPVFWTLHFSYGLGSFIRLIQVFWVNLRSL